MTHSTRSWLTHRDDGPLGADCRHFPTAFPGCAIRSFDSIAIANDVSPLEQVRSQPLGEHARLLQSEPRTQHLDVRQPYGNETHRIHEPAATIQAVVPHV